jgi:hypothetical protein
MLSSFIQNMSCVITPGNKKVRAGFDYNAAEPNELTLREGDIITVLKQDPSGWWQVRKDGVHTRTLTVGLFATGKI